jgi:hypothetical protein
MTLRHSVFRSVFQPVRSSRFRRERYFTEFTAAGSQYIQLQSVIAFGATGSVSFIVSPSASDFYLLGDSNSTDQKYRLAIASGKVYGFGFAASGTTLSSTTWLTDGKLHSVILNRDGVNTTLLVDGSSVASVVSVPDVSFDRIFGNYGGPTSIPTFNGYGLNITCSVAGTEILDMPLDEDWTENLKARNRAAPITISSNITPDTVTSPWVDNGDGSYTIDGSQAGNANLYYNSYLTLTNTYLAVITVSGSTAGGVRPYSSEINAETVTSGNGTFEFTFTPTSNDDINIQANSDFDGTVTYEIIDVTNAPAYGTAVNITSADAEPFDYDEIASPNEWQNADESVVLEISY